MKTALSVNLNKVALVRNARHLGIPSLLRAASICLDAGAHGITVHPRPDGRHIRGGDIPVLHRLLAARIGSELNIEGNPFQNLMDFVRTFKPQQCTFVPDSEGQFTSDHGWDFPNDTQRLRPLIAEAKSLGVRVSLFMDPLAEAMPHAKAAGADRVELYTESYASAFGTADKFIVLGRYSAAARAAQEAGLEVNAGHDLNLENLPDFLRAVPGVKEVSIGHAFVADALEMGYAAAVAAYLAAIEQSAS